VEVSHDKVIAFDPAKNAIKRTPKVGGWGGKQKKLSSKGGGAGQNKEICPHRKHEQGFQQNKKETSRSSFRPLAPCLCPSCARAGVAGKVWDETTTGTIKNMQD